MEILTQDRKQTRPAFLKRITQPLSAIALGSTLLLGAMSAHAAPVDASNIKINGVALANLLDSDGLAPLSAGEQKFRYSGHGQNCSHKKWEIKLDGGNRFMPFDSNNNASFDLNNAGNHQLKLTVSGFTNPWIFCYRKGQYSEHVVDLKIDKPNYTQTKYPIMVVPGVLAYDRIDYLVGRIDYIWKLAEEIEKESDHILHTFSLNPWQETTARGLDLAQKILDEIEKAKSIVEVFEKDGTLPERFPKRHYPLAFEKVNLLAHSHGSTTSRVAIRHLKEDGKDVVASLTTIAGPHFGTPTADGAAYILNDDDPEGWGITRLILEPVLKSFFHGVGCILATLAGDSQYCGKMDIIAVLNDFTQQGMYAFNNKYPSYGLPTGGKYFLDSIPASQQVSHFYEAYGRGLYDDWYATTKRYYDVVQADGTIATEELVIGNGFGQEAHIDDPSAVQYFSFTGDAPSNSNPTGKVILDDPLFSEVFCLNDAPGDVLMDPILCLFNSFYGVMYGNNKMRVPQETDFPAGSPEWIAHDGFIPVDSAKFGRFIDTFYWNHVDEQNQFMGIIPPSDRNNVPVPKPVHIYAQHANRLQKAGL